MHQALRTQQLEVLSAQNILRHAYAPGNLLPLQEVWASAGGPFWLLRQRHGLDESSLNKEQVTNHPTDVNTEAASLCILPFSQGCMLAIQKISALIKRKYTQLDNLPVREKKGLM